MANSSSAITKTSALLMKSLSPRNRDIISRRFGLKTGKKETLESIGKSYGITRERVRQIEEFSLNQLSKSVSYAYRDGIQTQERTRQYKTDGTTLESLEVKIDTPELKDRRKYIFTASGEIKVEIYDFETGEIKETRTAHSAQSQALPMGKAVSRALNEILDKRQATLQQSSLPMGVASSNQLASGGIDEKVSRNAGQ